MYFFPKLSKPFANNPTQIAREKLPSLYVGLKQSHWISWDHPCEAGPGHLSQEGGGDSLGFVVLCDPTTSGFQTKAKNSEDPVNPFSFPLHL